MLGPYFIVWGKWYKWELSPSLYVEMYRWQACVECYKWDMLWWKSTGLFYEA
jgi:hypothetical protein